MLSEFIVSLQKYMNAGSSCLVKWAPAIRRARLFCILISASDTYVCQWPVKLEKPIHFGEWVQQIINTKVHDGEMRRERE